MSLYRTLLRLLPPGFRRGFGDDMEALLRERLEEAGRSPGRRLRVWIEAVVDLLRNAPAEWSLVLGRVVKRTRGAASYGGLLGDARHAVRVFRRSPRFTLTALTLLGLGIGATTAIFSIAYAVLVRPLPYPAAERLVYLSEKNGQGIVWPTFEEWQRRAGSFEGLVASLADAVVVTSFEIPRRFESRSVTSSFFRVLGVTPFRGRLFADADARPDAVATAVISHAFWMSELGGAPAAIGQSLSLNRKQFTVIGVLPPGFRYLTAADVYVLLEPQAAANYRGMQSRRTRTDIFAVGRLKPGVTVAAAQAEMHAIAAALAQELGDMNVNFDAEVVGLSERIVGDVKPTLAVTVGAVILLLLIACLNLAGLVLNKSASRTHEFSVRAAIGGSRGSLIRQLLVEQALLVLTGGLLGALAGAVILSGLLGLAPRNLPRLDEIRLDLAVLSWTTLFSCTCAFLFGIVPAFKASGLSGQQLVVRSNRGWTRSASSLRRGLMVVEIAVATVLLYGAGLMVHTMARLARVDPGFDPSNLQSFMFSLTGPQWPDERKQVFYDQVVERLRAVPGVENAAITYSLPLAGSRQWSVFNIPGGTAEHWGAIGEFPNAAMVAVTAGYFETLGMSLVRGRFFDGTDRQESQPVAIITSSVARKYWPNQDPIGHQLRQGYPDDPYGPWRTIVGVVADIKQHGLDQEMPPQIFLPIVQYPRTTVVAIARTRGPVSSSILDAALHDLDRTVPVFDDRSLDQVIREASSRRRITMVVLSAFSGLAVLLAAVGLYGVIALGVRERRQEIGVRIAVGATRSQIVRLFLRNGLVVVAVGIVIGIAGALASARSLASLVFGVTVRDPATLGAVAALLTVVAVMASWMPARSATRVDPAEALRPE